MTSRGVHFSSATTEWATPQAFFDELEAEFDFTIDVCASDANAKCRRYFTRDDDGLAQSWEAERCWMNPPYGREIKAWMAKAYRSSLEGALVVCLIPARTDTAWWHDYVAKAAEVRFIRGRLRFGDAKHSAPFPSAVVVFKPESALDERGWALPEVLPLLPENVVDNLDNMWEAPVHNCALTGWARSGGKRG